MFGLELWSKYHKGGITIEYSTEFHENGLQFPGLTFCPFKGNLQSPWRNGTVGKNEPFAVLSTECNKSSSTEMLECIVSKAFNGYDYIEDIDIKSEHDPNGTNKLTAKSLFYGGPYGVCTTFLYPYPIGTIPNNNRFVINLVSVFGVRLSELTSALWNLISSYKLKFCDKNEHELCFATKIHLCLRKRHLFLRLRRMC